MSDSKSSEDSSDVSEDKTEATVVCNRFANDGSFLQMFKQMQQNMSQTKTSCNSDQNDLNDKTGSDGTVNSAADKSETEAEDPNQSSTSSATKPFVNINKRKPKTLKTGLIKKQKNEESDEEESAGGPTDAWNRYMKEVRKYKEKYGDDNDKNRPLVK